MAGGWGILTVEQGSSSQKVIEETASSDPERLWQRSLATAVRDLATLRERLRLPPADADAPECAEASAEFRVLVPESFLNRMQIGDPNDPLLAQVLPIAAEVKDVPGFLNDPVGDEPSRTAPGLLHKYHGRALLIAHGSCAIHCRYCFRRHFPYDQEPQSKAAWEPAFDAIRNDETLHEIILSGGDPLILSNRRLQELIDELESIPHLRRLRIHSRLPIVLPDRVTDGLIDALKSSRLQPILVLHSNHARELVGDCAEAIRKLANAGIMLLNQAVLLRGVNDNVEALAELCEQSVQLGMLPYYLHQLDRVRGAAHFEVPVETGRNLIEQLRQRLPGYAVPKYVCEVPGAVSKTPIL